MSFINIVYCFLIPFFDLKLSMCLKLKLKLKRLLFRTKKSDIQNIKQDKTLKVGQKIRTSSTKILLWPFTFSKNFAKCKWRFNFAAKLNLPGFFHDSFSFFKNHYHSKSERAHDRNQMKMRPKLYVYLRFTQIIKKKSFSFTSFL